MATADGSTYAAIVRLVREAEASEPPSCVWRTATRSASCRSRWRSPGSPGCSREIRSRALAVLVVATPCPLILAAPVAFIAGISRAARRGIIIKGGAAIEGLARARTLLLDKTGTLTTGIPTVARIETFDACRRRSCCAWPPRSTRSRRTCSPRPSWPPPATAACRSPFPPASTEQLGAGIEGSVDGRPVALGKASWVNERTGGGGPLAGAPGRSAPRRTAEGQANVFVAVDGTAGRSDHPRRSDPRGLGRHPRASSAPLGIERVVMVTGDHHAVAERVGARAGRRPGAGRAARRTERWTR